MKKGIAASKGYAIGKVFIQEHEEIVITDAKIEDVAAEKENLRVALEASKQQLTAIKEKTLAEIGEHEAAVFEAHLTLLDDPEFTGQMEMTIENDSLNAMKAVQNVTDTFVMIFESMDDAYMRERAADIKDVSKRIISNLAGKGGSAFAITEENTVVVAHDLTPSDTAQLDRSKVCGFLTSGLIFCNIGIEYAAVLPVPVCACPITSIPSNTAGMACVCIGDVSSKPISSTALKILSSIFNSSNFIL